MAPIKKIKILQTIRQGKVGGGETHVLDLVKELDKDQFESVILSFTEGPMVEKLKADGFKTYVVPTEKPFNYKVWDAVKQILKDEKIDLVHAHGTRANSNTYNPAKKLNIPSIYTVHGWSFHPDQHPLVKLVRTLSERFLVKVARKTICVSESNLREGASKFPMPRAEVIVNGINQVKFNPDQQYKDIRAEFGVAKDQILVGYIARITAQKEPLTYLQAIAKIPAELNLKFLIVGDGDLKAEMLQLAKTLNLESRIIFENFRDDIPAILHGIDIFCLPSLWEGLPIALLEAMAMRKAIIATAIDGTKDLVTDKVNGLLISTSNPDQLAEAIISLAKDEKLRADMGKAAGELIKSNFNIETMTRKVEAVYRNVLASKA
ncbi:glycosyltransferase family 4 protein [Pedobacter sp. L105]|uniref:glycosyltransferase family 4 protein n=1 Tax=Pedobacter sp. L105 TaxID=1641871 RepID=UPI00131E5CF2|nr:glycosyltransferase family 4 protein [Pedobacter sp. L105]